MRAWRSLARGGRSLAARATVVGLGLGGAGRRDGGDGGERSADHWLARPGQRGEDPLPLRHDRLRPRARRAGQRHARAVRVAAHRERGAGRAAAPRRVGRHPPPEPARRARALRGDNVRYATDALSYSLNDEDYLSPRLGWTYYLPPTVSSLQPADGPAAGGQTVTVRGAGLREPPRGRRGEPRCRFGPYDARARDPKQQLPVCDAPADLARRREALALPGDERKIGPRRRRRRRARVERAEAHCCAVGAGAARVAGGGGYPSRAACEAERVAFASCRYPSYAAARACATCARAATTPPTPRRPHDASSPRSPRCPLSLANPSSTSSTTPTDRRARLPDVRVRGAQHLRRRPHCRRHARDARGARLRARRRAPRERGTGTAPSGGTATLRRAAASTASAARRLSSCATTRSSAARRCTRRASASPRRSRSRSTRTTLTAGAPPARAPTPPTTAATLRAAP